MAAHTNIKDFKDYTDDQTTRKMGDNGLTALSKDEHKNEPQFNALLKKYKDPRVAAAKYLEWCESNGYTPKFSKFANHRNYYKLLEDFSTLIPDENGEHNAEQGVVKMILPTKEDAFGDVATLIEEALAEDNELVARRNAMAKPMAEEVKEMYRKEGRLRFRLGEPLPFADRQARAVENKGTVTPGLADKSVKVVEISRHDFEGEKPIEQAKAWAKKNLVGTHEFVSEGGETINYNISGTSLKKYFDGLDKEALESLGINLGIHLAVLKELPKVIENSIDCEEHPDYKKVNNERKPENGVNSNGLLVHRFYGAIELDGQIYRVKTTMKEPVNKNENNSAYNYEVAKIDVIAEDSTITSSGLQDPTSQGKGALALTKLLKGVEKSYDSGKLILDESEKSSAQFSIGEDRERTEATKVANSAVLECLSRGGIEVARVADNEAEVKAVAEGVNLFETPGGKVYGWTEDGKIYLTESGMDANTPIHEYTHLWAEAIKKSNPKGWNTIVKALKDSPVWNEVESNSAYKGIRNNPDAVASEVLSRLSGEKGQRMFEEHAQNGASKSIAIDRVRRAVRSFWEWVGKNLFGIKRFQNINEITDRVLYDLTRGTKLDKGEKDRTLIGVHNISVEKIRKAMKMGGFANPSVAVVDVTRQLHNGFGDISLIMPSEKLEKGEQGSGGTYQGDGWTPMYPPIYKITPREGYLKIRDRIKESSLHDYRKEQALEEVQSALMKEQDVSPHAWGIQCLFLVEKGYAKDGYNDVGDLHDSK